MPTLTQLRWRLRKRKWRPSRRILIAAVLLGAASFVFFLNYDLITPVSRFVSRSTLQILDGDTVRYRFQTVRLVGFDTPETGDRARCDFERMRASLATARLRELIASGQPELKLVSCACAPGTEGTRSCNYGRACGVLTVDGRDVGPILIIEGLARPFQCMQYSCPPRGSWC